MILKYIHKDLPCKEIPFDESEKRLLKTIDKTMEKSLNEACENLNTPDVNKLRAALKIRKAELRVDKIWSNVMFAWENFTCDIKRLIDVLTIMSNTCIYYTTPKFPIAFKDNNENTGLLFPIAFNKKSDIPDFDKRTIYYDNVK